MKKRIALGTLVLLIAVVCCVRFVGGRSEYYDKYEKYKYGFIPYYSTISNQCSAADRNRAQKIIETAGEVFTGLDSLPEGELGELTQYSSRNLAEENLGRVEADFHLITADFTLNHGYMWVEYSAEFFSKKGESLRKNNMLAYWKLKKSGDNWTVVKIKETKVDTL